VFNLQRRMAMMKSIYMCVLALVVLAAVPVVSGPPDPPPLQFELGQNAPNPFCADPGISGSGPTEIQFSLPLAVEIELMVWTPDATTVVRTLVSGALPAGYHAAVWDGRDDHGDLVPDGDYPYSLEANAIGGGPVLFADTLIARVSCTTAATESGTWGAIKSLFGN
jgi:FlgD Ig-like domain